MYVCMYVCMYVLHAALVRIVCEIANGLTKQQEKKQQFTLGEQLDKALCCPIWIKNYMLRLRIF